MTKIIISNNPENLTKALEGLGSYTVEAEYGEEWVSGSLGGMAHHGPRSGCPAPCICKNLPEGMRLDVQVIGVSHIDLDTLGGIRAVLGRKTLQEEDEMETEGQKEFWLAAGKVDVLGPHRLEEVMDHVRATTASWEMSKGTPLDQLDNPVWRASNFVEERLWAFWAYSQEHRVFAPRDGSVLDITKEVMEYMTFLDALLEGYSEEWIEKGEKMQEDSAKLEKSSFCEESSGVILRKGTQFVNHLYTHRGQTSKAVVGYNEETKAITLSLESPIEGFSCAKILQEVYGPKAGGHAGIGGTPRGEEFSFDDAKGFFLRVAETFQNGDSNDK